MNSLQFEKQAVALCEDKAGGQALRGGHTNNQIARFFMRFTEASEYRQGVVKRGWTHKDGWVERDTISPDHTGDNDDLAEYMRKSFAASRRMFEAGHRDRSLHHQALLMEEQGTEIQDGFVQLPSHLFGRSEAHTLRTQASISAKFLNEKVVNETNAGTLIAQLPIPATDPNLVREGPRHRADIVPSVIYGVEEYQGEEPLWRIAENLGIEPRHSPAPEILSDEEYNNRPLNVEQRKPLVPRRNSMTANEALWYATHCEEAAGKRLVALASWQGGAVFDAYRPKARFIPEGIGAPKTGLQIDEGSGISNLKMRNRDENGNLIPECGMFVEVDCREKRQIAMRPVDPNAINGRDSLVVLTFSSILRSGEPSPSAIQSAVEKVPMLEQPGETLVDAFMGSTLEAVEETREMLKFAPEEVEALREAAAEKPEETDGLSEI